MACTVTICDFNGVFLDQHILTGTSDEISSLKSKILVQAQQTHGKVRMFSAWDDVHKDVIRPEVKYKFKHYGFKKKKTT